jgi:oxygen-dependent protoporphyrinogen oxidase
VVDRLVDPLLGGINAGGVSDASAAAIYPLLLAVAQRRGSFMRAMHRATTLPADKPTGPAFWAVDGGMESMTGSLRDALAGRGVDLRLGAAAEALRRRGAGWELDTTAGTVRADDVILAVPARPAADLLAPLDPEVAQLIRSVEYASVALVTLRYPVDTAEAGLDGTGLLVPHGTRLGGSDDPVLVTACTYLSQKWPHLAQPGELVVRASVGRYGDVRYQGMDDAALVAAVTGELATLLGLTATPTDSMVTRWVDALPQYRVHHLLRVATVESALQRLGTIGVAGALYRGVGIPACIAGGRKAARELLDA